MGPARSAVLKILIASTASAASALLFLDLAAIAFGSGPCESPNAIARLADVAELDSAFRELISLGWLPAGGRAVYVGLDASAAAVSARRLGLPPPAFAAATACCALPFTRESFDFVFSAALDRARVPARVVLEMERVLRPGRVGAVFGLRPGSRLVRPEGLMRAAAPVASLLRFSDVIFARAVNGSAMIAFRKRGSGGSAAKFSGGGAAECEERITIMALMRILGDVIKFARAVFVAGTEQFAISIAILGGYVLEE